MIVHYQNKQGEEKLLRNIIALQNIDDNQWEAITYTNKTLLLFTSSIEMIFDDELISGKENGK